MCPECERGGKDGPEYSFWESHFVGKYGVFMANFLPLGQPILRTSLVGRAQKVCHKYSVFSNSGGYKKE
jgi:hypothetical protein